MTRLPSDATFICAPPPRVAGKGLSLMTDPADRPALKFDVRGWATGYGNFSTGAIDLHVHPGPWPFPRRSGHRSADPGVLGGRAERLRRVQHPNFVTGASPALAVRGRPRRRRGTLPVHVQRLGDVCHWEIDVTLEYSRAVGPERRALASETSSRRTTRSRSKATTGSSHC